MTNRIKQVEHIVYYLIENYVDVNGGTLYLNCHFHKELHSELMSKTLYPKNLDGQFLYSVVGNIFNIVDLNLGKHVWAFKEKSTGKFTRSGDVYDKTTG